MKKWVKRIFLGILLLFALLYGFVFLRSVMPVAVHDQELRLERAKIPEDQNAFDTLQTAATHLWWPEKLYKQLSGLTDNTNWDQTLASTVLASNREALVGWDAACRKPSLQVSEVQHAGDLASYLADWKKMAQTAVIRENFLMRD